MPQRQIHVVIIDDHAMLVESLARQLDMEDDLEVVGRESTMSAGVRTAELTHPDVAIVDYLLPDGDGAAAATAILAVSPSTQILMLTGMVNQGLLMSAIDAGCAGFLTKEASTTELVAAIRQIAAGEAYVPTHLLGSLFSRLGPTNNDLGADLTDREREVLVLLADGTPTPVIADRLFVSVNTVRNHVQRILLKLHAHSKLEAVAIATRANIIDSAH